jgi:L-lactate utilization protein LutB
MTHDFTSLASEEVVARTRTALESHGFKTDYVATKDAALARIKELVPQGASIMNGASKTLEQIGFVAYLKSGTHGWNNLHEAILAEKDPAKQAFLRQQSSLSDVYLGSAHAVSETGEIIVASNTGSQLPHLVFTSKTVILVVGTQKIAPSEAAAIERLETHVVPLEDERMMGVYGAHTQISKLLIMRKENTFMGRTVLVLFVGESLGY